MSSVNAKKDALLEFENYYRVKSHGTCYLGRLITYDNKLKPCKIIFLHKTLAVASHDANQIVDKKFILHGPVQLNEIYHFV